MPDAFDPYHKWLGIPPEDQPPDRYRLLGIQPWEDDPDVIEAAADQRMMLLRTYQTGPHSKLSQKLLNEVAAAKVCLLNPKKKAAYDQRLQQELEAEAEAQIQTLPKAQFVASAEQPAVPGEAIPQIAVSTGSHLRARRRVPWPIPVLAVSLVAAGVLLYALRPSPPSPPPPSPSTVLQFDWPKSERDGATLRIGRDFKLVPSTGPVEIACQPGQYRIVASRPGYKAVEQTVTVKAGERRHVRLRWEPLHALLVFQWPEDQRPGGTLVIDGRPREVPPTGPCKYELTRGEHHFAAGRPGFKLIKRTVTIAAGEEKIIPLEVWQELPPLKESALVLIWPEEQRADATLEIDAQSAAVPKTGVCVYRIQPGEHRVVVRRPGLKPFEEVFKVAAGEQAMIEVVLHKQERPGPPVAKGLPVPSEADRREQEERIRTMRNKARTPEERLALAESLFDQAHLTPDDPNARYVMLTQAVELAVELGDVTIAHDALRMLIDFYDVDGWALRADALSKLSRKVSQPVAQAAVATAALELVEPALDEHQYEVADQLATIGLGLARSLKDPKLRELAERIGKQVRERSKPWKNYQAARQILKEQPDHPVANLDAGKYLCLVAGDWPQGLPHLAKGSDEGLKALAERELNSPPQQAADQVELANAWRDLAEKEKGTAKQRLRAHAAGWYQQALPQLAGAMKAQVEERIEELLRESEPELKAGQGEPETEVLPPLIIDSFGVHRFSVLANSSGTVTRQDMRPFGVGKWKNDVQLYWIGGKPGDKLDLGLPVERTGTYKAHIVLTKAPDYAIVQLYLDGVKAASPIDLYDPRVAPTAPISLGTYTLAGGNHTLRVMITGANPKAVKKYMFGVDHLILEPAVRSSVGRRVGRSRGRSMDLQQRRKAQVHELVERQPR
jgi:hypothetical protein